MKWREHDDPEKEQMTVWSVFPATSDYFRPGDLAVHDQLHRG
ncbi:MAG: hypothetical protein R3B46_14320 [Phycisphaerales bacterium]